MDEETRAYFRKFDERFDSLDERLDNLESRVGNQSQLLMFVVADAIRDQMKKDDLYPIATPEQRLETALKRILERQNGLSDAVLDFLNKQSD